ncbi:hypothetical protein C8Q70DRAFT_1049360 [Cubamyces menziesii]|uniref:Pyrroline-5-carboxylate reductase n=1 Tax=Trametes cubensis TaxID=1111947 RepID=A0AAD7TXJ3_9APHY|nr:hypothetical protein C8Q70DRAFT_1049360 [Cubamyces menziesii]KAJ8483248.1 hypothetical protein ONZ51_g4811 [Trametes cubensis]
MGIAILSGVLASLESKASGSAIPHHPKWESHTPGTVTPQTLDDESLPSRFIACVSREESAKKLSAAFFVSGTLGRSVEIVCRGNVNAVRESNVVILCCKPQLASAILSEPGMREALEGKLLISILAGVTIAQLEAMVGPTTRVVRAMPNTPCKIREGMTVVSTLKPAEDASALELERSIILNIFSSIGRCRFLEEKHFDACTALSGSGPAFACIFLEAMADGGVMMGLPRAEALELAAQRRRAHDPPSRHAPRPAQGCSHEYVLLLFSFVSSVPVRRPSSSSPLPLLLSAFAFAFAYAAVPGSPPHPRCTRALIMVTNPSLNHNRCNPGHTAPGGCTIAGLLAMEDGRVRSTIARAIQVATERASELGQPAKK